MILKALTKVLLMSQLFYLHVINSSAQLRYPIVGTFMKKSAQGMAIFGDSAYLMNSSGLCRVLDLRKGMVVRHFNLASSAKNNHANTICFRCDKGSLQGLPLAYISECTGKGRCFVEQFGGTSSRLVQSIETTKQGRNWRMANWTLDNKKGYLYGMVRNKKEIIDSSGNVNCTIVKYRIPDISEGSEIVFSENDVLEQFNVIFPNVMQGVKIRGKYMYIVSGQPQSLGERRDARREIFVIDLMKKKIVKTIDLTYVTTNEPEDIDFYGKKCLLFCGHEGGIYEVNMKK